MRTNAVAIAREMPGRRAADVAQLTFRFPASWLKRIDALAQKLTIPGNEVTRATVLRAIVLRGLQELEREHGIKSPKNDD
jgi:hypothetical protein